MRGLAVNNSDDAVGRKTSVVPGYTARPAYLPATITRARRPRSWSRRPVADYLVGRPGARVPPFVAEQ